METNITFDEWTNLDLRAGEILEVEDIEGANKIYKLKVDLGTETRTLVGGFKQNYNKEELEGKRCIILMNLEPKTIKGIESHGMILAAVNEDHSEIKIIQPDGAIALGAKVS